MIQLNSCQIKAIRRQAPGIRPAGIGLVAVVLCLLLAACAPTPVRPRVQGDETLQATRESALALQPAWSFSGRLAISTAGNAGNARIEWKQDGTDYDIRLSAPITGQGWRLRQTGGAVSLEGLEGGTRQGTDAEAMLQQATGWRIPLSAMASWVRGARSPGASDLDFDSSGLPATLRQAGWAVEYRGWTDAATPLPLRVFASQPDASVRLVIERWSPP
ncbi:MAG: outer membrane lipoprotein LolB [Gammaproteobacteria bacterium RIFCSPHIGHO2_12_FULL_63_22]|nr:MAG: outer membrane lipoprotein LolB [Gammaproteobacteria bacterium RIFCSPHIGHO2_12_FULL_63_22]